jgi:hypothetical protein
MAAPKSNESRKNRAVEEKGGKGARRICAAAADRLFEIASVPFFSISKLERRADMYISTLRDFVRAMGGDLEITARFPDGEVRINQFDLKKTA